MTHMPPFHRSPSLPTTRWMMIHPQIPQDHNQHAPNHTNIKERNQDQGASLAEAAAGAGRHHYD